ncbi:MAG TPA: hypothetical protein VI911_07750 [Patescibacteria group bacterium]|nr:hypothetical protein [Patescibacteria group bacterium]
MTIKGIKYIGPILDNSGYAKACRGNILALHSLGVPITLDPISFEKSKPDLGADGVLLTKLMDAKVDYDTVIIHTTPEFWSRYREKDKKNVGYTIWETDLLHPDWKSYINSTVDKVLVGCEWNKEVFKHSGVTIPIGVVPHCMDLSHVATSTPFDVKGVSKDTYMFYAIFQWTERKHPTALIKAYWHAFQNNEDVALVLKTYRSDYSEEEKDAIRITIRKLKAITPMDKYPPIYLLPDMLTEDEVNGLHKRGDCYASLDRGEGFGIGPFMAGAFGNPIVVTGFGGVTEYAKQDNSYLVNYTLTPVYGMPWSPWYRGDQLWAEPDVKNGADLMKFVYDNKEAAKTTGQRLKQYINTNFSLTTIGTKLLKELELK